jgi:G:T/U-mismatch repair DNA glycosylase
MTTYNLAAASRLMGQMARLPKKGQKAKATAWLLIANDEPDQICYTKRSADKERKELEAMGCTVIVLPMVTPGAAEELESAIKYGPRSLLGAIRQARAMGDIVKGA